MDYRQPMQRVIDYIEENLEYDLPNADLAKAAGYSPFHFLRIFCQTVCLTPSDYVRKRRLSEIVRQMESYDGPISDLAFRYGFNSKENFVRAFKSEFRILPTEYKRKQCSLRLYDRISFTLDPLSVTPQLLERPPLELTVLPSPERDPVHFWNRYNCSELSRKLTDGQSVPDYGVCRWNGEEGKLDYWIGVESARVCGKIEGCRQITVPGGLYARFDTPKTTHFNFVSMIGDTWAYIRDVWLPGSPYMRTGGYEFECYREDSRTFSEEIYIPIQNKGASS